MFSKKTIFYSMVLITFFGFFVAKAEDDKDDDEDDISGEIIADLFIGLGIAICEEFVMCKFFMLLAGLISFIVFIIGVCVGDVSCLDLFTSRNTRRGLTVGAGYGLTRSFRNR
jgi:hypothetical protein